MESIALVILIAAWFVFRAYAKHAKRRKFMRLPFPKEWEEFLRANIEVYHHLPDDLKSQLRQRINVFVGEKVFEGCGGLEITDEIKVTVAAQACLLILNRKTTFFPKCKTIYVYLEAYVFTRKTRQGPVVTEDPQVRLGESWTDGPVVLSWDDVKKGAKCSNDGENVVLHEFAHQLDQEDGRAEGYPLLDGRSQYLVWARHLGDGYKRLRNKLQRNKKTVLGAYAATHPAEYFAVATEVYFESPELLKKKFPKVYEELRKYYKVDPVEWFS